MEAIQKHYCRVCGWYNEDPPWGDDNISPTYEICPCCGCEYGNDDYEIASVRRYRVEWISDGVIWFDPKMKPAVWSLKLQMQQIPEAYL